MSRRSRKTAEKLRAAFEVEMSDEVRDAHTATIARALAEAPIEMSPPQPSWWRKKATALITATMVVLPAGAAVAAEGTAPGDLLYPVKRIVESVRVVVDSDIVARHRVDELDRLLDRPGEFDRLADAVVDAGEAVTDLPSDHPLRDEFASLTDRVTDRAVPEAPTTDVPVTDGAVTDEPLTDVPADQAPTTEGPDDRETQDATTDVATTQPSGDLVTDESRPPTDAPPTDG